jgi:UDP-N-acetyl-D-mannosaminuronate dehydrogenase
VTDSDPYVFSLRVDGLGECISENAQRVAAEADCVVIVTDHAQLDYAAIARQAAW